MKARLETEAQGYSQMPYLLMITATSNVTCPMLAHVTEVKLFTLTMETERNMVTRADAFPAILTR